MSSVLASYETRRKERHSSQSSSSAEALEVRGMGSSRKGKEERGRSKSRPGFRDLKRNQCAFCREIGHWKVDCPKFKGKKKESKAEANLSKVTNTQRSSSQADGSDSDSSGFSFSVSSPIIGNSWKDEWILDTGTTYHACPNRGWFSNFEKLEKCSVVMGDDHSCSCLLYTSPSPRDS